MDKEGYLAKEIYRSRARRKLTVRPFEVLLMSRQYKILKLTTQGEGKSIIPLLPNWNSGLLFKIQENFIF